jgi:adenine-specific DNA-methyltransferase
MILKQLKPRKALNKAFLRLKPNRTEIDGFKSNLISLLDRTNDTESEEFHKNLITDFLKKTSYDTNHFINTKGRNDLVIHNGQNANSTVGVIIEAKKPTNKAEMITTKKLNAKAFQELILYYLRERITHKNLEVKHLVATNINEWFIFDATLFDRLFAQNKNIVKQFNDFEGGRLADTKTDFFYKQIAEPFIDKITCEIEFTYFNIQDFQKPLRNNNKADDNSLIALFKLLSPQHLLKLSFTNDSNSLDKRFYSELLHIIGLTETKEGSKKLIERKKAGERHTGTILEDAIIQLDSLDKLNRLEKPNQFGSKQQERLFNVALELSITWINRILFLKLLEAQLINYSKGDKSYSFLNLNKIKNFDDLNSLFFQVLARKYDERNEDVKQIFRKVPYLNSSLFEPTDIEQATLFISNLKDDKTIPIFSQTVLKDQHGKKKSGNLSTLQYLFEFLDAYDFGAEGGEEIREDNKTLINASVLGLIFEKINGYKDGSFFTPGFITMYMCRETIRKAVVQKFNETKKWNCTTLEDLYDKIEDRKEANKIVNSIKICDPAVGSGHFLVSSLNEMIAVKNDLKILQDRDGKRLKEYQVEVVNDELIVTDEEGKLFEYNPSKSYTGSLLRSESQRIQETLFHEKQTIIENCLFGVDINSNSVKICRLRLWIELLKNAYYKNATELETLPNIDINIKCGNSLVSRFAIDADLKQALRKSKWTIESYKLAVSTYRNAESKDQKREMERLILEIKQNFSHEIRKNDPLKNRLDKLASELYHRFTGTFLFEPETPYGKEYKNIEKKRKAEQQKIENEIEVLSSKIEEIKANKIFENSFEWRFEFPEVLNDDGDFVGFDVVIGNPPYIRQEEVKDLSDYFQSKYKSFSGKSDIYVFFYENSINLLKPNGLINFITSGKFFEASYGKPLIEFLLSNSEIIEIINFNDLPVFEGATAYPLIYFAIKKSKDEYQFNYYSLNELPAFSLKEKISSIELLSTSKSIFIKNDFKFVDNKISNIIEKVKIRTVPIKDFCGLPIVGVKTGFNEGFLTDLNDDRIVKPYVFGRDIKKYSPIKPTNKIIFPYNDDYSVLNIEDNPKITSHLENQKAKLSQRAIIKEGLINNTKYWYEYQQINKTVDYNTEYITYPNVSFGNNFTLTKGVVIDMTGFLIKSNSRYLLAILNSKLIAFLMNIWSISRRGGYLEYKVQYIEKIPIKNISEIEQKPFIELVETVLAGRRNDNDTTNLEDKIDQLVYQLYELTEEEIEIIENN